MRYRDANREDARAIAALHAENWSQGPFAAALTPEYIERKLLTDRQAAWDERFSEPPANQFTIVAESKDGLVGFSCAYGGADERGTFLDNLHVGGRQQRMGIGRELLIRTAIWSAKQYPGDGMYLFVLAANERARAFYERFDAAAEEGDGWDTPDGGWAPSFTYLWTPEQVREISAKKNGPGP